jgi:hypothetical protein
LVFEEVAQEALGNVIRNAPKGSPVSSPPGRKLSFLSLPDSRPATALRPEEDFHPESVFEEVAQEALGNVINQAFTVH